MAYASYADIVARHDERIIIQLSDDNADGVADATVIDAVLAEADAEINARIATRYAVPMNPVPMLATRLAASLAVGLLHTRRAGEMPAAIKDAVQATKKLLDRIGEGKAGWGDATQPASDKAQMDVRMQSQPRIFGRTSLKGF